MQAKVKYGMQCAWGLLLLATSTLALNIGSTTRRGCLAAASAAFLAPPRPATAFEAGSDDETSGLVVLRVAEVCLQNRLNVKNAYVTSAAVNSQVCQFQEKVLRTIAKCSKPNAKSLVDQFGLPYCGGDAYVISPGQILFGTGLLLKNSNLDGNLRLMIGTEVPRKQRDAAVKDAIEIMNTFNYLIDVSKEYQTFEPDDMLIIADIYASAREKLARFFDYLPESSKSKFYVRHHARACRPAPDA